MKERLRRLQRRPMEVWFLAIFLAFGLLFVLIIPPGWNTDETNHSYRIQQLAEGNLRSEEVVTPGTGLRAFGGSVPTGLVELFDATIANEPGSLGNANRKLDARMYWHNSEILQFKKDGRRMDINFSGAALYSPVSYALFIPVFWLGSLLSLPFFWIVIISRLVGLAMTGLAIFFAIRITPIGKWIFLALGLVPTVVAQSATVGADAPQLALCLLFAAWVLKLVFTKNTADLKDYVVLALLGAALVLIKFVYAPLLLLLAVLPLLRREYKNRRAIVALTGTVLAALIPGLIWMQMVAYIDINSNPQADFAAQKLFVVTHPFTYLQTLYYTFFTNTQTALGNMFGSFIWDSVALPAFYAYLITTAVVCSLFVQSKREMTAKLTSRQRTVLRVALLGVSAVTIVLIATALYVYSTTLRQSSIVGIQSRYFLPLLPLVLLVFYGNTVKQQLPLKRAIIALSCVSLIGALLAVYMRLYQTIPLILS